MLVGLVVIAVALLFIRNRNRNSGTITGPGLVSHQDQVQILGLVPNVTQRLWQQNDGTYSPNDSAANVASYPGALT